MTEHIPPTQPVFCLVYVPAESAEMLKKAMFDAGAGQLGLYSHCAWQVSGQGQFIPHQGAQPTIGQTHQPTEVTELCIHCIVTMQNLSAVIAAIKQHHPYETPAYVCLPCLNV